jgi:hypothetical protein
LYKRFFGLLFIDKLVLRVERAPKFIG